MSKNVFTMNDVRDIFNRLHSEEITMSKALEILNKKADEAQSAAFDAGWRARVLNKGSQRENSWTKWKAGDGFVG